VYVFPAESVTPFAVAEPGLHTPTSTTRRLPTLTGDPSVTEVEAEPAWCVDACCTNSGVITLVGVTAFDGADADDVPTAFVAVTVKV
jgi:hypothetical protein